MNIPNGKYRARAVKGALGHTSTGKEQVAVLFQLLDEGWESTTVTWHGYFTTDTMERTLDSLSYCGWDGENIYELENIKANEVSLTIENETYQGNTVPKVQWVNRLGGGLALKAPMNDQQAKAFGAQMRGNIAAWKKKQGQPRPANNTSRPRGDEPPPPKDEDLY